MDGARLLTLTTTKYSWIKLNSLCQMERYTHSYMGRLNHSKISGYQFLSNSYIDLITSV